MNAYVNADAATYTVIAPSSREALRLVRERLGPDAIVVSNRVVAEGVEVVAAVDESAVEATPMMRPKAVPSPSYAVAAPSGETWATRGSAIDDDSVLREIHSMRGMIEEQLAGLAWNEKQRRDPVRGHLLRTLLGAGFSTRLAQDILENLPTGQSHVCGMDYAKAELARRTPILEDEDALMEAGGVYALMGPTGVGKTTTTAKLAARCVMRFGAEKLALVTTDTYRIGAYEQLRIYGQILGVSVHAVKDAVDLEFVLAGLRDKHMVLIDTVGRSQRDRAVSEQIAMLCDASRPVKRLLLLNASSHGDTLNEVVQAYRHGGGTSGAAGLAGCIFTKVDESTHPGALIDMAIRHQLPVHYISSGQGVPEHLMLVDRNALVDSVFQARSRSALFVPGEAVLDERPEVRGTEADVTAAEAVSERLRSQCQQLIRALTLNAQELKANADALAGGQIGFEETRVLWRQLAGDPTGRALDEVAITHTLVARAGEDSVTSCRDYVLAMAGQPILGADGSHVFNSTLLLSDRTGLPFAAPQHSLCAFTQHHAWAKEKALGKPVVHLLARVPAIGLIREWQSSGYQWIASGSSALRIVNAADGRPGTLAKLVAGLSFGAAELITYRKKPALLSVAEARVSLRADLQESDGTTDDPVSMPVLRCVVKRIVDASSGKSLTHSYVLASEGIEADALDMARWPAWRSAAEPYFKFFKQGLTHLDLGGLQNETTPMSHLLIAGQISITLFLLQCAQDDWADTARRALTQLAGRSARAGRPVPGSILFEGLTKLLVLLDVFDTEGVEVTSPSRHIAAGV